ncbi:MAG: hypothetical protein AAGC71_09805 [Pseudomonadota bacterium]
MNRVIPLLLLIAGVAVGSYIVLASRQDAPVEAETPPAQSTPTPRPETTTPEPTAAVETTATVVADEPPENCLSDDGIGKLIIGNVEKMRAINLQGTDFEALRGIDATGLNDLATQGDSAAMVVMAFEQIVRANGADTGGDVAATLNVGQQLLKDFAKRPNEERFADANTLLALQEANYWLYEAALRGRLGALGVYGEVIGAQLGGSVGLRWLTKEEFESAERSVKRAFRPANVYRSVAAKIALPGANLSFELDEPYLGRYEDLVNRLVAEFETAATDADLPDVVPVISKAEAKALLERACPGGEASELWSDLDD